MLDKYPDVLTIWDAMEILGIGRNKIYELLNRGELHGFRIGRNWRISKAAIRKFIEEN